MLIELASLTELDIHALETLQRDLDERGPPDHERWFAIQAVINRLHKVAADLRRLAVNDRLCDIIAAELRKASLRS